MRSDSLSPAIPRILVTFCSHCILCLPLALFDPYNTYCNQDTLILKYLMC